MAEKKKKLYLKVSNDKYELPEAVADSVSQLARMLGITASTISSQISRGKHKGKKSSYMVVEVDEE